MKKTATIFSLVSLVAAQAGAVSAAPEAARAEAKASTTSCDVARPGKAAKKIKVVNACQNDTSDRTPAYVFAGALVAGAIAIGVSTTNHHNNTASP